MRICSALWTGALIVGGTMAVAQPQGSPQESGRPAPRHAGDHDRRPPPPPLVRALDADGDRVIDADEIKNASAAILTLDMNGDGQLSDEEVRPPRPPQHPGGQGDAGRPHRHGGPGRAGDERPDPERFVEHALEFDADGDGSLSRAELREFAEQMPPPPPGGPRGAGRPSPEAPRPPSDE